MTTRWVARHGLTGDEYQAEFDKLVAEGLRLTDVTGYSSNGQARYAAIWDDTPSPEWTARHGLTGAGYQAAFDDLVGQGFRLVQVNGYEVDGEPRYAAIWHRTGGPDWVARHGLTGSQYQAAFDDFLGQGYRLVHVSGYSDGGDARYAAIWTKASGPAWEARHGLTSEQYQAAFDELTGQGYRLVHVSGYSVGRSARYAAIWHKGGGPAWAARHGLSGEQYQAAFDELVRNGMRLTTVSGYAVGGQARFAAVWQDDELSPADQAAVDSALVAYMNKHSVPGLSVAIAAQERLVFAKGYGLADEATQEMVTPAHLFRVASISKPITAVAVMELVENGNIGLDDAVFGDGAILGTQYGTKAYSETVKAITVRHLLQHTSGWSNDGGDPMFMNPGMSQAELIGWVLDNREPKTTPGTANEYLNFGYCVLGRVIEEASGQSYEDYVRTAVLAHCGVDRMHIGGSTQAERRPEEVVYYAGNPYGLNPRRMDAHGGWIASPSDLLRFMVRTDGFPAKTDVLFPNTEQTMFSGSPANPGYGLGWIVEATYRGHNGAMNGTIGFLVSRTDGISFAVLANTRPSGDGYVFELKAVVDGIIDAVSQWPDYDLF